MICWWKIIYFSWPYLSTQKADLQTVNLYFDLWWKLTQSPNKIKRKNHNGRSNSLRHSYGVPRDCIVPVNTERATDDGVYWHSKIVINSTPNNKSRIVLVSTTKGFFFIFFLKLKHPLFYLWWNAIERALFSFTLPFSIFVELFSAYIEWWNYHLKEITFIIFKKYKKL